LSNTLNVLSVKDSYQTSIRIDSKIMLATATFLTTDDLYFKCQQ